MTSDTAGINPLIDSKDYCNTAGIELEIFKWFEKRTLHELLGIHQYIVQRKKNGQNLLREVIFSSILNRCCSQRDHYTYITDRCFPKEYVYKPAKALFLEALSVAQQATRNAKRYYEKLHSSVWNPIKDGVLLCSDSRDLRWIGNSEVDLVVTSPPYLGVNDYVRSMRLQWLFFPEDDTNTAISDEIGARRKRSRPQASKEYLDDMTKVFEQIARVLKPNGFLCLVIGQGKGKINKANPVNSLLAILQQVHGFEVLFECDRKLKFRRIQVPGIGTEKIIVFSRQKRR